MAGGGWIVYQCRGIPGSINHIFCKPQPYNQYLAENLRVADLILGNRILKSYNIFSYHIMFRAFKRSHFASLRDLIHRFGIIWSRVSLLWHRHID